MKAVLIRNASPADFGGAERFAVDLARELLTQGWQPLVVSRSKKLLAYADQQRVEHRTGWWWRQQNWSGQRALGFPIYLLWQFLLVLWYGQLFIRFRPQVVHPQSKDDFIAATIAGKLLGRRVIWTDHADLKYVYANHHIWYKNPVGKLVYAVSKLADQITVVSQNEYGHIAEVLGHDPDGRYVVVYNGARDTAVKPHPKNPDDFVYCATSRLVSAKGIGELLAAFQQVNQDLPNTRLWLVGDGPEEAKFKQQAAETSAITFFGHSDAPLDFVAGCDVFVHPSYHEGFSLSLVEAAMLGRPIIAGNVGGNPEIIRNEQTGLLVPVRDVTNLAAAMKRLHDDQNLAERLGKNARQSFETSFRFEKIVEERFVPIYEAH